MSHELREFLTASLADPAASWSGGGLRAMARLRVPDRIMGQVADMLRGDVHRQWAEWFVGTICDIEGFVFSGAKYPKIYQEVTRHVAYELSELRPPDSTELSRHVARLVYGEVQRRSEARSRIPVALARRRQLVDMATDRPHCSICGWRFGPVQVAAFLGEAHAPSPLPVLVDVYKPIGLNARHLRVEVDHLVPHSRGGTDDVSNLRLCCGWCNVHKSDRSSIYEVPGEARLGGSGAGGRGLPQPFWVVRLMALEAERGRLSPKAEELTVAPRNPRGSLNPSNLMVVSYLDDPLGSARFQARDSVARLWRGTTD